MRIEMEYGQLTIYTKAGPIHRPHFYIMDKSCGWQWEWLNKRKTGHWWLIMGRLVFTTM